MPLRNLHVLVTRPKHQADNFCASLETAGAIVSRLPVIEISSTKNPLKIQSLLQQINEYDIVIFISSNAVEYAFRLGETDFRARLSECRIGAIGRKTARALNEHKLEADIIPEQGFTSEDYLALPEMQAERLSATRIIIIRGEGGRELLAKVLRQRGAIVDYLEVYRRICPPLSTTLPAIQHLVQLPLDIIAITSSEGLHNLMLLLQDSQWLKTTPLLLGSKRIAHDAKAAGFTADLVVADDPGDCSMQKALLQWRQEQQNDRQTR